MSTTSLIPSAMGSESDTSRSAHRNLAAPPSVPTPPSSRSQRIPSLDGIRALSIAMVVAWHLSSSGSTPWLGQLWRIDAGNLGVRIFFVLVPVSHADLLRAATYSANYLGTEWTLGHSWSLAVEEQFYLLWPSLIVLLGVRRSFLGAALVLLLSPIFRGIASLSGQWPDNPRYTFECVADALATGCLLAYARPWLWSQPRYRRALERRLMELWPLIILAFAVASARWEHFGAIAGLTLLNVAIAVWIDWCLRFPDSRVGRMLNARPIAFVGVLSYSIYLWQQPFLREGHTPRFPINVLCIGIVALASFFVVERPMLRLRARVEKRSADRSGTILSPQGR